MSPYLPYRPVADFFKPKPPEPPRIGCSHPVPIDITAPQDLLGLHPHDLTMCNVCGARWCTPREVWRP